MTTLGSRFASAIAELDRSGLQRVLGEDLDFKGLTPGRFWEAESAGEVEEILFGHWFEGIDRVTRLAQVDEGVVGDTQRVGYRLELQCPDGPYVVEQQAYYRSLDDRIIYLRIVCSGFRAR